MDLPIPVGEGHHDVEGGQGEHQVEQGPTSQQEKIRLQFYNKIDLNRMKRNQNQKNR